jgi:chemotaxis methyl-accepting protein methylase
VLNVWSAGAAAGEEAYTIAMLMHDYAHAHDESTDRFRVLGTDIDRDSLRFAQRAEYSDFAMTDTDAAVRVRWFDRDGSIHRPKPVARERDTFATLDLIRDVFPQEQHLIFCRYVIIYF